MNDPAPLACNLSELAYYLHVSRPTAYKMTKIKGFPGFKIGSRWIINIKGIQTWLDQLCGLQLDMEEPFTHDAS